jgi:hypothetical protein
VADYVGDRDLFEFKLEDSRAVNAALHVDGTTRSFTALSAFLALGVLAVRRAAACGESYLRHEAHMLARLAAGAATRPAIVRAREPGAESPREYRVLIVNAPLLQSELGDLMMRSAPDDVDFAVVWYYNHDRNEICASARTNRPAVDLSRIAPNIIGATRGGGHPKAAGFAVAGDSISAFASDSISAFATPL